MTDKQMYMQIGDEAALLQQQAYVPTTEVEYVAQSENLIQLRRLRKRLEEKFNQLQQPFKDGLKNLRNEFKLVLHKVEGAESLCQTGVLAYRAKKGEEVRQQNEQAVGAYFEAVKNGEQAMPPVVAEDEQGSVVSEAGSMSSRAIKAWRFRDRPDVGSDARQKVCRDEGWCKIPDQYFVLDYTALNAAVLRAGLSIEGVEVFEKQILTVRGA